MSDENSFTGTITITPPLTATEIRALPELHDVGLHINKTTRQTADGELTVRTADAVTPPREWGGAHIVEDLQALVDQFGAHHEFGGFIEAWWELGYGPTPPDRFLLRDGRAVRVQAQIVWPGDGRPDAQLAEARDLATVLYGILNQQPTDLGDYDPSLEFDRLPAWLGGDADTWQREGGV